MRTTLWWLGLIFGTLSVVMLIKHGFEVSFVSSLQVVLDYYEQAANALFSWAEPWIKAQLAYLRIVLGYELELYPHWKHVLVIVGLYCGSYARIPWLDNTSRFVYASTGVLAAVVTAIVAGTLPIADTNSAFLVAGVVLAGVMVFELVANRWHRRGREEFFWTTGSAIAPLRRFTIGIAILLVGTQAGQIPGLATVSNLGLAMLLIMLVVAGIYWLIYGAMNAGSKSDWWERFKGAGSTHMGLAMLGAVAGAMSFVALNAGLKLAGL